MRFTLKSTSNGCRLARFDQTDVDNSKNFNTPMCLLHTRGGSAPYLTRDLLNKLVNIPGVAQMPLTLLADNVEIIKHYGRGIGSFASMKDFMVYCCMQDSSEVVPAGYNSNAGVAVWGRGGKITPSEFKASRVHVATKDSSIARPLKLMHIDLGSFLNVLISEKDWLGVHEYMTAIDAIQPDWFQALCDSDTDRTSSRKRVRKSVDRTLRYLDECIGHQSKLPRLKNADLIGVVEGGYFIEERIRSARETAKQPVSGFCIEGFHSFGPEMEHLRVDTLKELLQAVLAEIPDDKPRLLPGVWSPLDVIQAVKMGIDIFDCTYPYVKTAKGFALVFGCDTSLPHKDDEFVEISLNDDRYREDTGPLVDNCTCYTCTTHTRAYIHHLLDTTELLAGVLLMMHNFHHYFKFFETIRNAIANNSLDDLEERFAGFEKAMLRNVATT